MVKRSKQSYSASHSKLVLLLLIQLTQTIYRCIVVGEHKTQRIQKHLKTFKLLFSH